MDFLDNFYKLTSLVHDFVILDVFINRTHAYLAIDCQPVKEGSSSSVKECIKTGAKRVMIKLA